MYTTGLRLVSAALLGRLLPLDEELHLELLLLGTSCRQTIATDLVGPFPESDNGNQVIANYFTRWVEAFPLTNQEASTVAK